MTRPFLMRYILPGIALVAVRPWLGELAFISPAVMWLVPDRRVERYLEAQQEDVAG